MKPVLIVNDKLRIEDITGAGVAYESILHPIVYSSGNPANPSECLLDALGFIRIKLELLGVEAAQGEKLVAGWSYLANQGAAVKVLVNAQVARIGAGVDGTVAPNVRSIQLNPVTFEFELNCDAANTVKTFYVVTTGSTSIAALYLSAALTKLS